jgi:hypothetical protein
MTKSESIKNIAKALMTFQFKAEKIKKDSTNPFFKSKYASLSNILDHIQIPMGECGLSIAQFPDESGLTTILMHADSGEYIEAKYLMPVAKINDPQAVGSSITYARRYALGSILGLNIDEDDDGNHASQPAKRIIQEVDKAVHQSSNQPTPAPDDKKWLNRYTDKSKSKETIEWKNVIEKMGLGVITMTDVKKSYKVSKEIESMLNESIPF